MLGNNARGNEVILFHAGQALVLQVADWIRKHTDFTLRLVSVDTPVAIEAAMNSAAMVIVDGTKDPDEAIEVLEIASECVGRDRVAVYTEQFHDGLEVVVRMLGSLLLPGPMSPIEWQAFFETLHRDVETPAAATY